MKPSWCLAIYLGYLTPGIQAHPGQSSSLQRYTPIESHEITPDVEDPRASPGMRLDLKLKDTEQRIRLVLTPNDELSASLTSITVLGPGGEARVSKPGFGGRAFKGSVHVTGDVGSDWRRAGWARVMFPHINSGIFQGAFEVDGDIYHIEVDPAHTARRATMDPKHAKLAVRRSSDDLGQGDGEAIFGRAASCSVGNLGSSYSSRGGPVSRRQGHIQQRDLGDTFEQMDDKSGCPEERQVAMLGIAADCSYTAEFDSLDDAKSNILNQINTASQVYEDTFNIALRVMNLTISDRHCPVKAPDSAPWNLACTAEENVADRLSLFSRWRAHLNNGNDYIRPAMWTLLTACNSGSSVGLAWEGQVCQLGFYEDDSGRTIAATNIVVRTQHEWQVMAHEIAHSFGAVHDCNSRMCKMGARDGNERCCQLSSGTCDAGAEYLMNPSARPGMKAFSPCTIKDICSGIRLSNVRTDCLVSEDHIPLVLNSTTQCGNGILEEGEDCDCGGTSHCRSVGDSCCDPKTCRFADKAVCDPLHHDCCTKQCQPAPRGLVCRRSKGVCDPEEVCNGELTTCPQDSLRPDGEACEEHGVANLTCASGVCTSRDLQCQEQFTSDNDTMQHCDDDSCRMNCRPAQGIGEHLCPSKMEELLLDGTPCGDGRLCYNGKCEKPQSKREGDSESWFTKNRIIIIVCSVVGGVVVFVTAASIFACIRRTRRRTAVKHGRKGWPDDSHSETSQQ